MSKNTYLHNCIDIHRGTQNKSPNIFTGKNKQKHPQQQSNYISVDGRKTILTAQDKSWT